MQAATSTPLHEQESSGATPAIVATDTVSVSVPSEQVENADGEPTTTTAAAPEPETETDSLFTCSICFDVPVEPVITLCGHMFCWPCLYRWIEANNQSSQLSCPVCKAGVTRDKIIPIYGRGRSAPSSNGNGDSSSSTASHQQHHHNHPSSAPSAPPPPSSLSSSSSTSHENAATTPSSSSIPPPRPMGQRSQAMPNPNYNPQAFRQFPGMMGIGHPPAPGMHFQQHQFSDMFGMFRVPFLSMGFHANFGNAFQHQHHRRQGHDNNTSNNGVQANLSAEELNRQFASRLFLLLGMLILLTVIFM